MLTRKRVQEIAKTACPDQEKAFLDFVDGKDFISIAEHCFTGCQKCPAAMDMLAQESGGLFVPGQVE